MSEEADFISVTWRSQLYQIEIKRLGWHRVGAPLVVFLHEGLGSIAMWRDFPARLCEQGGFRGLVFSRPGFGRSSPRAPGTPLERDFMHQQALEVLPAVLAAAGIDQPAWILGHSDGGSIALIYAAHFPERVLGLIVLAPHITVESVGLASIARARDAYETGLAQKLRRYHDDVDSVFWGWNRIWLDPDFATWDIREEIRAIGCPILAIQGLDDEYGTLQQIRGIAAAVPTTLLLELANCRHSPHRDQPDKTSSAAAEFIASAAA